MFCKKLDNFKNKPAGVLKTFYDQMPTLPASDDITRFDGTLLSHASNVPSWNSHRKKTHSERWPGGIHLWILFEFEATFKTALAFMWVNRALEWKTKTKGQKGSFDRKTRGEKISCWFLISSNMLCCVKKKFAIMWQKDLQRDMHMKAAPNIRN